MSTEPAAPGPQPPIPTGPLDPRIVLGIALVLGSATAYVTDWDRAVLVFTSVVSLLTPRRNGDVE